MREYMATPASFLRGQTRNSGSLSHENRGTVPINGLISLNGGDDLPWQ